MTNVTEKQMLVSLDRFLSIREQTEKICAPLKAEDMVVQPIVDVSPPKWHLAHTTWFFETFLLIRFLPGYKVFNERYNYIFNSYYESIGERVQRDKRGNLSRPTYDDIIAYRAHVNTYMLVLIANVTEEDKELFNTFFETGLQHEQQHQELLITDLKYILGNNPLYPAYFTESESPQTTSTLPAKYFTIPAGLYTIGCNEDGFAWDNEKPAHQVYISEFNVLNRLITNGEYLQFINDGGYKDFRFWLSEGWGLLNSEGWAAPLYWHNKNGHWLHYTLNGLQELDMNAPVTHISFYEADAYASWAGKRLLTEPEWEIAASILAPNSNTGNFVENNKWEPQAAQYTEGDNNKLLQMHGDAWEWTYSAYFPYPGYKRAEGALGEYNGKFMINQMVLKGGSCTTPISHYRPTYRNFFHTDKRWQYTGIRLAY